MEPAEIITYLALLESLKKEDKRVTRFDDNFETQASLDGDYYKPKEEIYGVNYNALKFKQLTYSAADDVNELLTAPLMSNISIPLVSETTQYSVNLEDHTAFIGDGVGSSFRLVSPSGDNITHRIWMRDTYGAGAGWNGHIANITSANNPTITLTGPDHIFGSAGKVWIYQDVVMGGDYAINWTAGNVGTAYQCKMFIVKASYVFEPFVLPWNVTPSNPPSASDPDVYYVTSTVPATINGVYANGGVLVDTNFVIPVPLIAGVTISGSTLNIDTTLWDNSQITVKAVDVNSIISNTVNVTLA
jgi:hypothetical protein